MPLDTMAVQQRLRVALGEFLELDVDEDGDLFADFEAVRVFFAVTELSEEQTALQVYAVVHPELPSTPALFRWVAVKARLFRFGALGASVREDDNQVDLVFSHHLVVDGLADEALRATLLPVVYTAAELRQEAHQLFAGG